MKIIKVNKCQDCPHSNHNDGGGHGGSFVQCDRFGIMLSDEDGPQDFDIWSGIHPDCRLSDMPEK